MEPEKDILQSSEELRKPIRHKDAKKGRILLILLGAIVLLSGVTYGIVKATQAIVEYVETNVDRTIHITNYEIGDVKSVVTEGENPVTVTKLSDVYFVEQLNPAVTSQAACESAFANAAELLMEKVASKNVTDFSDYGLDTPSCVVHFSYKDGKTLDLEIGAKAPASQFYYVRFAGEKTVYLMKKLLVDLYSTGPSAFHDVSSFSVSTENVDALTLEKGGETLKLRLYDKIGGSVFSLWQIVAPESGNADSEKIEAMVGTLDAITMSSYVARVENEDLRLYGLDEPTCFTIHYRDGATLPLQIGKDFSATEVYARIDDTNDVYLLNKSGLALLEEFTLSNLIYSYANIIAMASVDEVTVTMDGKSAVFSIDRSGEDALYKKDGALIDGEAFKETFQTTNLVEINGFADDESTENAPSVLTLTYAFHTGEAPFTVEYLDVSINSLAVRKNGSTLVTVSKDKMEACLQQWERLTEQER